MCLSIHQVLRRVWLCYYSASRRLCSPSPPLSLLSCFPLCPPIIPFQPVRCSLLSSERSPRAFKTGRGLSLPPPNYSRTRGGSNNRENLSKGKMGQPIRSRSRWMDIIGNRYCCPLPEMDYRRNNLLHLEQRTVIIF